MKTAEEILDRFTKFAEELEEPVFRIALLLPDREMGRQEGEDAERPRIAGEIRKILGELS